MWNVPIAIFFIQYVLMKLKTFISGLLFFLCGCVYAQSYKSAETDAYVQRYHKIAVRHMLQYKIPASITLAQGILESGSGRSTLAIKANNHFGIKCKEGDTGPSFFKTDDKKGECFRKYKNAEESFEDHAKFLAERKYYQSLFKLKTTDYKGWAKGLKNCGYATNSKYPSILIAIIEQNKLYEYDKNPIKYTDADDVDNQKNKKDIQNTDNDKITPSNDVLNGVRYVVVQKGNTLYGIARSAGVSVSDLLIYNDINSSYVLKVGERIFIQPKQNRFTSVKYHIVKYGESVWAVSQLYAIKQSELAKINNIKINAILKPGQRLKLN